MRTGARVFGGVARGSYNRGMRTGLAKAGWIVLIVLNTGMLLNHLVAIFLVATSADEGRMFIGYAVVNALALLVLFFAYRCQAALGVGLDLARSAGDRGHDRLRHRHNRADLRRRGRRDGTRPVGDGTRVLRRGAGIGVEQAQAASSSTTPMKAAIRAGAHELSGPTSSDGTRRPGSRRTARRATSRTAW